MRKEWKVGWFATAALLTLGLTSGINPAAAEGELVVYCGVQEEWCRAMVTAFEKETGITVNMTRKSAGEVYAQVQAEATNPKGDVWWGGTGDPHLQAAAEGLTEEYTSPNMDQQRDWSKAQWERGQHRTIGIYSGALGFGYNSDIVKDNPPKCWADLIDAKYKDEVQVADPNSSGTAYTMLATLVQLMGEDKAFEYLKNLNKNVNQYTKSGAAPSQAVARGETGIGISFQHDLVTAAQTGPVKVVSPCEGTGYEIGGMSIIKGAPNLDNAKKWYDWALTADAQKLGAAAKAYQLPSNTRTPVPPESPDLTTIKLINYDFAKYGSPEERKRLLSKWDSEVKSAAK